MANDEQQTVTEEQSADETQNTEVSTDQSTDQVATPEPEKVEFNEAQQKKVDGIVAKQGLSNKKALMAEQARSEGFQQRITNLESQVPQAKRPEIPAIPDSLDDDFQEKMAQRDTAIQEAAAFDTNQSVLQQRQTDDVKATQQAALQADNELASSFMDNATKLGVSEAELSTAVQTVAAYGGLGLDLGTFVAADENGPLATKFLAENPAEILKIQGMTSERGAVYLMQTVMPKAIANKQSTGAPDPADTLSGNGTDPSTRGPKGATYE